MILYRGRCKGCDTTHERIWASAWVGSFGEDFYGADCRKCGPGHQLWMDPVDEEDELLERQLAACRSYRSSATFAAQ